MTNPLPTVTHIYQNHHLDSTRWRSFQPRPDDIIISTSYKSGTTWTQGIVRQLVFLGHTSIPPLDQLSPWLDRGGRPLADVLAQLDAQTNRRFIKSHLALDGLIFHPHLKYIVVGRDPRDVCMSLWNHYSHYTPDQYARLNDNPARVGPPFPQCPDDIHEFARSWITRAWFPWESEGYPYWGNLHHTAAWWDYRHLDNILFVHFGDLLANLTGEISRIAAFLNIPVPAADLPEIAQRVSLAAMRSESERDDPDLVNSFQGGAKTFYFQGINGRWKNILTPAELELFEIAIAKNLTPDAAAWLQHGRDALSLSS
jgi:aryl sulfotransferase